jgi:hypothetical protein
MAEDAAHGRCESCGREDEQVRAVRRVYLTPGSWDTEARTEVAPEVERWCGACLANYPHELLP